MNPRYGNELNVINASIETFNRFLNPGHQSPTIKVGTMITDKSCVEIIHGNWDAFGWPDGGKRGVYFILGREATNQDKNGIYVGKASYGSTIAKRLYSHLHPFRSEANFIMKGYHNEIYILEYMISLDLDSCGLHFIAPALEEFLISDLRNKLNLINGTGN